MPNEDFAAVAASELPQIINRLESQPMVRHTLALLAYGRDSRSASEGLRGYSDVPDGCEWDTVAKYERVIDRATD